jgi:hypothetical protein
VRSFGTPRCEIELMEGTIIPYDVFRIDKATPGVTDSEFGAYQLPNGDVRVLTNNFGQSQISFESKEQADVFLSGEKSKANGQIVQLNPEDYPKTLTSSIHFEDVNVEATSTPQHRVEKENPAGTQDQNDKNIEPDQINGVDRAKTNDANNNLPENLRGNLRDDSPNQNNAQRADKNMPEMAGDSDTPESFGDKAEREISDFFGGGQSGANQLIGQLENYVLDGGSPILGALGATGLDALNLAMDFTKNTALGILDTRNLGEYIKQGDVKAVAGIVVNVLPAGKVAKVINAALTVSDISDAVISQDAKALASTAGFSILGGGKGGNKNSKKKGGSKNGKQAKLNPHDVNPNDIDKKFRRDYVSKRHLTEKERSFYKRRLRELNSQQDPRAMAERTTGLLVAENAHGDLVTLVGSSQPRVPPQIREKMRTPKEQEARGVKEDPHNDNDHAHHAEPKLIAFAASINLKIVEVFSSRVMCGRCNQITARLGVPITNP